MPKRASGVRGISASAPLSAASADATRSIYSTRSAKDNGTRTNPD
ncbi:hypothetical protein [Acinetobacter baumannii]|nr:hypothetical protein [Acinetobacter baumannii]